MSTYYVRTTGNDSTGTGATGAPWATLSKALTAVATGDIILMGDGTYAENTGSAGYLNVTATFSGSGITIGPESGFPDKVIITGTGTDYAVVLGTCSQIRFDQITLRAQASTVQRVVRSIGNLVGVEFRRCKVQAWGSGHGGFGTSSGGTPTGLKFVKCDFEQIGYDPAFGLTTDFTSGSMSGLEIRDCRFTVGNFGVRLRAVSGLQFLTNEIDVFGQSVTVHGFQLGEDDVSGAACSGVVAGNRVRSINGHAAVIGAGCNGVLLTSNIWTGGNQGLVIKGADNVQAIRETVYAGQQSGIYFKASRDCQAFDCTVYSDYSGGAALRVQRDPDNNVPCQRLSVRRNRFIAKQGAVISWGPAGDDNGGSICDENVYVTTGTATLGSVYGTTITSLSTIRTAWSSYDKTNNDRNSRTGAKHVPFGGAPLVDLPS